MFHVGVRAIYLLNQLSENKQSRIIIDAIRIFRGLFFHPILLNETAYSEILEVLTQRQFLLTISNVGLLN